MMSNAKGSQGGGDAAIQIRRIAVVAMLTIAVITTNATADTFDLGPAPVTWGDTTRDGKVDINDLVALGQGWQESQDLFGDANNILLGKLGSHWGDQVPGALRFTENQANWERRPQFGALSAGQLKAIKEAEALGQKDFSTFRDVGFGVSFDSKNDTEWKIGNRIYEPNPITSVNSTTDLTDYAITPPENGQTRRFNFVENKAFYSQFLYTYDEELDFFSLDVNLEAKYALFSGSVSANYSKNQYRNTRVHKYVGKLRKDFGWFYVPKNSMVISKVTQDELDGNDPDVIQQKYGTHYIYAKHLFAEMYFEVNIKTAKAMDRTEFGARVSAQYDGGTTAVNFAAATKSLSANLNERLDATLQLTQRGGPDQIEVDGAILAFPVTLNPSDPELLTKIEKYIAAWDTLASPGTSDVASDDWYIRPISDFLPDPDTRPFSKEASLRDWFRKFNEADRKFNEIDKVFNFNSGNFEAPYRYLTFTKLPDGLGSPGQNTKDYVTALANNYKDRRIELLEFGRDLYEGRESFFNPADPRWEILPLALPRPGLRVFSDSYDQCDATVGHPLYREGVYRAWIEIDGDFTQRNNFSVELADQINILCDSRSPNDLVHIGCFCQTNGYNGNIVEPPVYNSSDNHTAFLVGGESVNLAAGGWGSTRPGLVVILRDVSFVGDPMVVDWLCLDSACTNVSLNFPLPSFLFAE